MLYIDSQLFQGKILFLQLFCKFEIVSETKKKFELITWNPTAMMNCRMEKLIFSEVEV